MNRFFKELKELFIITGIFTLLIGTLIYLFYYIQRNYTISSCSCKTPVQLVLIGLVIFGIFLGAAITLFTSLYKNRDELLMEEEKNYKNKNNGFLVFLKLVEPEERIILDELIKNNGILKQSELSKKTSLTRVKITRTIKRLVEKGALRIETKNGKNILYLSEEFLNIK
jgi:DNA-binding MarR family transcriptional regulator